MPWHKNNTDQLQLLVEFRLIMVNLCLDPLVLTVHLLFKSDNTGDLWKTNFTPCNQARFYWVTIVCSYSAFYVP